MGVVLKSYKSAASSLVGHGALHLVLSRHLANERTLTAKFTPISASGFRLRARGLVAEPDAALYYYFFAFFFVFVGIRLAFRCDVETGVAAVACC